MSHSGWSTSNYISALGGSIPTAVPLTMHARYNPSAFTAESPLITLSDGSTANSFRMAVRTLQTMRSYTNTTAATSTGTLSAGTWYSLVSYFETATIRRNYINGSLDGFSGTSVTPTGINKNEIGINPIHNAGAFGSLAEVAIWNVALTADEIAALVNVSPLLIRPQSLACYIPLLDSGTLDLVAPAATVTGTLTKDNDHPRVILPRQRSLIGVYVDNGVAVAYAADLDPGAFTLTGSEVDAVATGQSTADTHDGIGYGDPFRRKRRPKKGKREKAVEDLLKKLMGLVPDDPPPAIEAEAEIAQASVERLFAPTVDVTPNLEALQFAQLQLAKLEAMLNRYLEDEDDDDDLLLMAA